TSRTSPNVDGAHSNNSFQMRYIKIENDPTVENSSSAMLDLPMGAEVLFAGLYWSGQIRNASGTTETSQRRVKFRPPGAAAYNDLVADQFDSITSGNIRSYQSFDDVTEIVRAAGSGAYTVADVASTNFAINIWAGWSLVVTYRDADQPLRD